MKDAGAIVGVMASTVLEKTGETDHAALLGVGMAVGAMELAFSEAGLASMQAGGFDRDAFRELLAFQTTSWPCRSLLSGRLLRVMSHQPRQEKASVTSLFRVGDDIR